MRHAKTHSNAIGAEEIRTDATRFGETKPDARSH
jgi:hypothetical protein